jgi:hypothetical protein
VRGCRKLWVLASRLTLARIQANALMEKQERTAESKYEWGAIWMKGRGSCHDEASGTSLGPPFGDHELG